MSYCEFLFHFLFGNYFVLIILHRWKMIKENIYIYFFLFLKGIHFFFIKKVYPFKT